jgi:hypothetical protein
MNVVYQVLTKGTSEAVSAEEKNINSFRLNAFPAKP